MLHLTPLPASKKQKKETKHLMNLIAKTYHEGEGMYGSSAIHGRLNNFGVRSSKKRVAKLTKKHGLAGKMRKSWKKTTKQKSGS